MSSEITIKITLPDQQLSGGLAATVEGATETATLAGGPPPEEVSGGVAAEVLAAPGPEEGGAEVVLGMATAEAEPPGPEEFEVQTSLGVALAEGEPPGPDLAGYGNDEADAGAPPKPSLSEAEMTGDLEAGEPPGPEEDSSEAPPRKTQRKKTGKKPASTKKPSRS